MQLIHLKRVGALVLLLAVAGSLGGTVAATGSYDWDGDRLRHSVACTIDEVRFGQLRGYDVVGLPGGIHLTDPGLPMIPVLQIHVALPPGMRAERIEVLPEAFSSLDGTYDVYPAQPRQRISTPPGSVPFVPPDPDLYASDDAYPQESVVLLGHTDLAGQAMAVLELRPLRYLPRERCLQFTDELTFDLVLAVGYECGDYLPAAASPLAQRGYAQRLRQLVINPTDVQLQSGGGDLFLRSNLEPGTYEYVIIAGATLAAAFEPLAEWKTRKGVPARIVTTSWIFDEGGYGGSDQERIRAFIIDARNAWGATYILLGGDTNTVPCHWRSSPIEPYTIPNDTYYADFDDDWTVEIAVGRAAVRYTSYINTFNQKTFNYEQSPPLSDYAQSIGMLGFDLDNDTAGEDCKNDIISQDVPGSWDVATVYDSDPGTHKDAVLAVLNAGQNLVNHIDHCDTNEMGVGSIHHDEYLWSTDFTGLTNELEQSILYSLGCYAGNYEASVCVGEHTVRYNTGGAIAFAGNSRYGWYNPGSTQTLSFRYDRQFFREMFAAPAPVLGDVFAAHKNAFYPADNTYRYIYTELTLLGDPELQIWTADPATLEVTHEPNIISGPTDLTVAVMDIGGGPLADARVCIWKRDEVYQRGWTDGSGTIVFGVDAETAGTLLVTVTRPNFVPYLGDVTVLDHSGAVVSRDPAPVYQLFANRLNPFRDQTELRFGLPEACDVSLRIYDVAGRQVRALLSSEPLSAGVHGYAWHGRDDVGRALASGVYLYRLDAGPFSQTRRLILSR